MSQGYLASQQDTRNLGTLVNRLVDDLNSPDLSSQALSYIQDAIRFYQRQPFLFNEVDNTSVAVWAPNTIYPQGSLIQANVGGTAYAVCALNQGTSDPATPPNFPTTIFTTPPSGLPPPLVGTPGTIIDPAGGLLPPLGTAIMWATVGLWSQELWTQLATVYNINQYLPPLDYIAPNRIEVTTANLRLQLEWVPYGQLRDWDVVQPAPITAYPRYCAWFQQQIYTWPYANGFYPITLSYRTAPTILSTTNQVSFWTTQAEGLIRAYAAERMCVNLIHDMDMAAAYATTRKLEERALRSHMIAQRNPGNSGLPASEW